MAGEKFGELSNRGEKTGEMTAILYNRKTLSHSERSSEDLYAVG